MPEVRYTGKQGIIAKAMAAQVAAVNQAANHLVAASQDETPVDKGVLKASIHTDGAQVSGFTVTAKVSTGGEAGEYAELVHEGTQPHVITASHAMALAFNGIVVKSVNHPGTRAYKYIELPLIRFRSLYLEFLRRAVAAAF